MAIKKMIVASLLLSTALLAAGLGYAAPLYFPHVATTDSWQTEIAIINTGDQAITGTLRARDADGGLVEARVIPLSAHGRREVAVASAFTDHSAIRYMVYETNSSTVQGYTKFFQAGKYRVAIPAVKEVNASDIYIPHIASTAEWWTGVGLVNTTSTPKVLTITFNRGQNPSESRQITLGANQHTAFDIAERFFGNIPQPDIESAVITNAGGVIGLELFGSSGWGSQLEGILLTDRTTLTIYYPHVADDVWWTGIVAYNPADLPAKITVTPYKVDGTILPLQSLPVPGKRKYVGAVGRDLTLPAATAWFKIDSTRELTGFELFGSADGNQLGAFAGGSRSGAKTGVFPKIEQTGGWTGIAFVNTEAVAANVALTAYDDTGTAIATQPLTVPGYAKVANAPEVIFSEIIWNATYIAYSSDRDVVGFQLNGSPDNMMLDGLPALGDGGGTPAVTIPDSDVIVESGMTREGGVARQSTQIMTGSLPNPTGSAETYGGKAYLVLNGDKIPLSVTRATSAAALMDSPKIKKDGKEYYLNGADKIAAVLPLLEARAASPVTWVFSVTFSINAGPNTVSIEVFDENDTIYARMPPWNIVGVILPTNLVVTLWWDTNGTDIDLHMSPDDGTTHCYYRATTAGEMNLDYDNRSGYGPEHITVENATGTKTYKIKVYYYRDHNTNSPPGTTPTTANVTASINGELKLSGSRTMTAESTTSSWTSGAHVWDVGEVEVAAHTKYTVTLDAPDLASFPTVKLRVTVTDPGNAATPKVTGLTAANFYVINAGKAMSPVTITAAENVYTLTFTDILAGRRDLFVYVNVPAQGTTPMKGGLSNTMTYGTNYAVIVGLNEYPAQEVGGSWFDDPAQATKFFLRTKTAKKNNAAAGFTVDAADFTITLRDLTGGTNRPEVSITASGITAEGWDAAAGKYTYLLSFNRPANYLDYDNYSKVTFKKEIWLTWCVKDTVDLKAALLAKGTGMSSTSWDSANITTYLDSAATKTAILSKIEAVARSMQKYDMFLFHFSGHGSGMPAAGNGAQYLCAYEDSAWINVNDLQAKLSAIPNPGGGITNAFVLMDACHSGNFIGKDLLAGGAVAGTGADRLLKYRPYKPQADMVPSDPRLIQFSDLTALPNTLVMAAQTGTSSAWDDGDLKNGVFTHYLVEGINVSGKRVSAAPANGDHSVWISGEEAFNYLNPKTRAWVSTANGYEATAFQHPQLQDNSGSTAAVMIYNW
ncbi:MAG: caspase family protein [Syntrophales bacterium]